MRANYNLPEDPQKHVPFCPVEKEQAIIEALKHYKLLEPDVEMIPRSEVIADEG